MGAIKFYETASAATAQEAFGMLRSQAVEEYGNDPYNGTISTTDLVGEPVIIARKYSKRSENAGYKYAEQHAFGEKWEARALDLGVMKYRITTAEKLDLSGAPEPEFAVRYEADNRTYETQEQAEQAAMQIAQNYGHNVSVCKVYVPVSGSNIVSQIVADAEECEKLPGRLPAGAKVEKIHMWAFYGWAAE